MCIRDSDKGPHVDIERVATNHQQDIEWLEYHEMTATRERKSFLDHLVNDDVTSRDDLRSRFLQTPLYNKDVNKSFMTLYSMQYDLSDSSATVFWPGKEVKQSFDKFTERREVVNISKPNLGELIR